VVSFTLRSRKGYTKSEVHSCPGDCILHGGVQYLWALCTKLASCHACGAWNLKMAPKLLEDLWTPALASSENCLEIHALTIIQITLCNVLNQNSNQEEIKSRLKPGNACYQSVQNLLSSSLLYKNLKIKIYRTIILPVVLYGCETWSLTLREERRRGRLRIGC
jgi:hypothetical protein